MRRLNSIAILCAVSISWAIGWAAAGTPAPQKKTASKTTKKKSTYKRSYAKSGKKSTPAAQQSWRNSQRAPTPERYKEIQQALAARGYLKSEPDGSWSTPSVDALKRFQQDQNLQPTGRVDSLSLIALGLGPKREQP